MAQLNALQQMVVENKIRDVDLSRVYGTRMHFPVTFRHKYATWIESQDWERYAQNDSHTEIGRHKFEELHQLMKDEMGTMQPLIRIDFKNSVDDFVDHYMNDYDVFINMMSTLLRTERMLIQSSQEEMGEDRHISVAKENTSIIDAIHELSTNLKITEKQLTKLEEIQVRNVLLRTELLGMKKKLLRTMDANSPEICKLNKQDNETLTAIYTNRQTVGQLIHSVCEKMYQILQSAWKDLDEWKEDQRVACTMRRKPKEGIIEVLDNMFESVATVFVTTLGQIDRFLTLVKQLQFSTDLAHQQAEKDSQEMDTLLMEHLHRVFIVDKNIPKQVLKVTNGKSLGFNMSVRLLGGHALGLSANKPKVSVKLYPEKQINDVMVHNCDIESFCKIQSSTDKSFQFINRGNCFASFDSMIVGNVKREGKGRNDDFVTDYKHAFIFFTIVRIQEKTIPLKTMSLPIVITSQTSQECMARGTIIWSSAFPKSDPNRPFAAEEEVEWKRFAEVINAMFVESNKRPLTAENLNFLAQKAFRESNDLNFDLQAISLKAILKDKLPGCEFPFWKWFVACLNLVQQTLLAEWKEGLIYGFISKGQADRTLQNEPPGTFLIRFSESKIGSGQSATIHGDATIAVNEAHPQTGQRMVFHIKESLTHKVLAEKKLAPILDAYKVQDYLQPPDRQETKKLLTMLWTPEKRHNFEDVFGKYIKEKENKNDGYRRGRYVIEIFLTDQRPRRTSTQTPWLMSPPPQSPTQSEYSDMGSPMPDMTMNTFNMNGIQMFVPPLQQPCTIPQQQPVAQIAIIQPNSHQQIPTVVQENNEPSMLAAGMIFDSLNTISQDGTNDEGQVIDEVQSLINYLDLTSEAAGGIGTVPTMNHIILDPDGDAMLDSSLTSSVQS